MTTEIFNDAVEIQGSQDAVQLRVQGHSQQTDPLQTWEDHAGTPLARVTGDGRLEIGDLTVGAPDALLEVNNNLTLPTSEPFQGIQSHGRVSGVISNAIAWMVSELELLGSGGISGLHTALRSKLIHSNTGDTSNAELRAADFEAVNQASGTTAVGQMTGLHVAVTNQENAELDTAVGIDITLADDNSPHQIQDVYGLRIANVNQGTEKNYAIHTADGAIHIGDHLEFDALTDPSIAFPDRGVRLFSKSDNKLWVRAPGSVEYPLGPGNGDTYQWDVTLPPEVPSAYDNEFTSGFSEWTEFDPYTRLSEAVADSVLTLTNVPHSGSVIPGLWRTLPGTGSAWTVTTRLKLRPTSAQENQFVCVAVRDRAPANDSAITHALLLERNILDPNNKRGILTFDFIGLSPAGSGQNYSPSVQHIDVDEWVYFRIRYSGDTTLYFDVSLDGVTWETQTKQHEWGTVENLYFGLCLYNFYSYGDSVYGDFDWFRYTASSVTEDSPVEGRYITVSGTVGDMLKSVYDADDDGRVSLAGDADTVDGQHASAFAASGHTHSEFGEALASTCEARLTLASGIPVPIDPIVAATTVYLTPYKGNKISLYDGARWNSHSFSEISIKLSDTQSGQTTNGSPIITGLTDSSQWVVGMQVTGTGIPLDTVVQSIDSATQVTLNKNASATGLVSLTFKVPPGQMLDIFGFDAAGSLKLGMVAWQVPNYGTITNATNLTPITITSNNHGLPNGAIVYVQNVQGNTAVNGLRQVINALTNTFQLKTLQNANVAGNGTYTGGGTWTRLNETALTRSINLVSQDGIYLMNGDSSRRYLGTVRTYLPGETHDSLTQRFVFNYYNQVPRKLKTVGVTDSWSLTGSAWRAANNYLTYRVEVVIGAAVGSLASLDVLVRMGAAGPGAVSSIAYDATSSNAADTYYNLCDDGHAGCHLKHHPAVGYHYYQWIENARGTTSTVYAFNLDAYCGGITGEISL